MNPTGVEQAAKVKRAASKMPVLFVSDSRRLIATQALARKRSPCTSGGLDYHMVVLGPIFLKYISDAFDEHHGKLVANAVHPIRTRRKLFARQKKNAAVSG